MKILGVIPARYASTRFEGKPLKDINGNPMIEWVYKRAKNANIDKLTVATDDKRIFDARSASPLFDHLGAFRFESDEQREDADDERRNRFGRCDFPRIRKQNSRQGFLSCHQTPFVERR